MVVVWLFLCAEREGGGGEEVVMQLVLYRFLVPNPTENKLIASHNCGL